MGDQAAAVAVPRGRGRGKGRGRGRGQDVPAVPAPRPRAQRAESEPGMLCSLVRPGQAIYLPFLELFNIHFCSYPSQIPTPIPIELELSPVMLTFDFSSSVQGQQLFEVKCLLAATAATCGYHHRGKACHSIFPGSPARELGPFQQKHANFEIPWPPFDRTGAQTCGSSRCSC